MPLMGQSLKIALNHYHTRYTLFILAYNTGYLMSEWKLANVVPIHKKDDKSKVVNYRPISLTSLVMKVFERILYDEL